MGTFKLKKTKKTDAPMVLAVGDPIADEYLAWLAGRKSENTRLAYGYDLIKFLDWIERQAAADSSSGYLTVRPIHLLKFVNWLSEQATDQRRSTKVINITGRGYAEATVTRIIRAVTSFYDYLVLTERLAVSPMPHRAISEAKVFADPVKRRRTSKMAAITPKLARRRAETLDEEEIRAFMDSLRTKRDRLLFELLLMSGVRISEALNLRLSDVNFAERSLMIQPVPENIAVRAVNNRGPKRDSSGVVGVHPKWFALLNDYLTAEYPGNPDGFVFVVLKGPNRGKQLTYKGFYSIVDYHRAKAGAPRVRPHRARHTFATKALRAGVRREVLKKQLRHASEKSLDQYAWVDDQELLQELEKVRDDLL
jgi:integrase/recombinase XerC